MQSANLGFVQVNAVQLEGLLQGSAIGPASGDCRKPPGNHPRTARPSHPMWPLKRALGRATSAPGSICYSLGGVWAGGSEPRETGLEAGTPVELAEAEPALASPPVVPVSPGLPESSLRSECQRVSGCLTLVSVLCVESLSPFLVINCQSVGLLCPVCSGLCVLCVVSLIFSATYRPLASVISVRCTRGLFSSLTNNQFPDF